MKQYLKNFRLSRILTLTGKEEEPQSVEIESKEEENVEEDGFIGRESCMECL